MAGQSTSQKVIDPWRKFEFTTEAAQIYIFQSKLVLNEYGHIVDKCSENYQNEFATHISAILANPVLH